ncbi:TPA: hypothetical protein ACGDON_003294, partial [Acinetobacter baumannii]
QSSYIPKILDCIEEIYSEEEVSRNLNL